jgi:hypothetical protein
MNVSLQNAFAEEKKIVEVGFLPKTAPHTHTHCDVAVIPHPVHNTLST